MAFKLVNINPHERRKIGLFFFQNFFEGLGVAFFYTLALTYFLETNPIKNYPWIFISAGLAIMVFATIYAKFEHHGRPSNLFRGLAISVVLLLVASLLVLRSNIDPIYTGIGLLAIYQLIYYVNKTQFWGLSALSFDVRESKRLFSVLSVGDLPAKFIGYTIVVGFVVSGKISLDQLIYASVVCYLISLYVLNIIIKEQPELKLRLGHDEPKTTHDHKPTLSPIIKGLMILALANVFCVTLIDYLFAKEVKHHFEDEGGTTVQLISMTLAISYGVATLVKLFVSGRILQRVHMRVLLVTMPVILILSIVTFWFATPMTHMHDKYNYFFIILFIIELVLKETLNKPLVLTLFQPLSKSERLNGHTLVKGYFESGSMLLVGLFLLNTYRHHDHVDLNSSTIVLMLVLSAWVLIAWFFGRTYLRNLRSLIRSKLLRGDRALFLDPDTSKYLKYKLRSTNDFEVVNAAELLFKNNDLTLADCETLVCHLNTEIRSMALRLLPELDISDDDRKALIRPLFKDQEESIRLQTYHLYATLADKNDFERELSLAASPVSQMAFYKGWCEANPSDIPEQLNDDLSRWLDSGDSRLEIAALELLQYGSKEKFGPRLNDYLAAQDLTLRRRAIYATQSHLDEELIGKLVANFDDRSCAYELVQTLSKCSEEQLDDLDKHVKGDGSFTDQKICQVLVAHDTERAAHLLGKRLQSSNPKLNSGLAELLVNKEVSLNKKDLIAKIDSELELLESLRMDVQDEQFREIIESEYHSILQRLLKWCYVLSNEHALLEASEHYQKGDEGKLANAIEALQISLPQNVFSKVRPILEREEKPRWIEDKEAVKHILEKHEHFRDWLVGYSLLRSNSLQQHHITELQKRKSGFINENLSTYIMADNQHTSIKLLERVLLLKSSTLFTNTDENHLLEIAEVMKEHNLEPNQTVFHQGDEGNSMYIIVSGSVRIEDEGHILATLKESEFFGDLSLLDPAPRSAAAITNEHAVLLELNEHAIYELMADHIEVTRGVIKVLCERLRRQNKQYLLEKQKHQD